jgi:hypothetical protein
VAFLFNLIMKPDKAKSLITAIASNKDGIVKYTYELTGPDSYMLKMYDYKNEIVRHLSFEVKKVSSDIEVHFTCHGFKLNFPLKKNVESFVFNIYDFRLLIEHGVKVDVNLPNPTLDLDVEF